MARAESEVENPGRTVCARRGWVSWRMSLQGLGLAIALAVGCDISSDSSSPAQSTAEAAKAEFEWAMQRLHRAIDNFHPPANLGIHVKREMTYEYHPADEEHANPTAEVTIASKTIYNHGRLNGDDEATEAEREAQEKKQRERQRKLAQLPADAGDLDDQTLMDLEAMTSGKEDGPDVVAPRVQPQSLEEEDVYELEYKNRRWQLVDEPEHEHVEMWFEYALAQ